MPIPTQGFPRAAAVSPRLQVVDSVDSTNAKLLRDAAVDPDGHPHLAVVVTDDQRAGRGRLDRVWAAPAGTALAISRHLYKTTGFTVRRIVRALRPLRDVTISIDGHELTAPTPPQGEAAEILAKLYP